MTTPQNTVVDKVNQIHFSEPLKLKDWGEFLPSCEEGIPPISTTKPQPLCTKSKCYKVPVEKDPNSIYTFGTGYSYCQIK